LAAEKVKLKRGFKANAERLADKFRADLNIHACAPLCAFRLAEHLGVAVYSATEIDDSQSSFDVLSGSNGKECEWSALTMKTKAGNTIIIYNPFHSTARQQSDVMHELAHVICEHERNDTNNQIILPVGLRSYNPEQEEEAKCLGSTLQLSKPCLLWSKKRNMSNSDIASHFNASLSMVTYRMNITGLSKIKY
jgi:Zn-dependent peptidase ImmA (M78 family)